MAVRFKLLTTKTQRFEDNIEYEGRHGTILEVDPNREWFVALTDHKLDDLNEFSDPMLILFQKKMSRPIARMRLVIDQKKSELFIGDFESGMQNKGYGSILLRNVIELAKTAGLNRIKGNLSAVDSDHFDKISYMYSKYKFDVKISGKGGTILRRMK